MSCMGMPRRYSSPGPSPVRVWALDETLNIFPNPPVANRHALVWNTCRSPVANS